MNQGVWIAVFLLVLYLLLFAILGGVLIVSYIFQGIGLSAIAKRRGIRNPWLAWVPVADAWILGSVSDQYRNLLTGEDRNFRQILLKRKILFTVTANICASMSLSLFPVLIAAEQTAENPALWAFLLVWYFLTVGAEVVFIVFSVRFYIVQYKALFDLYRSCNPKTGLLFFILSFFSNIGLSLGFFLNRNNDLGMPHKTDE